MMRGGKGRKGEKEKKERVKGTRNNISRNKFLITDSVDADPTALQQ